MIRLKEYIEKLQEIYNEHGDIICTYASDPEGNRYDLVPYNPSTGYFDVRDREFSAVEGKDEVNAVCIN